MWWKRSKYYISNYDALYYSPQYDVLYIIFRRRFPQSCQFQGPAETHEITMAMTCPSVRSNSPKWFQDHVWCNTSFWVVKLQPLCVNLSSFNLLRLALVVAGFVAECLYLLDPRLGWLGPLWSPQCAWWTSVGHLWLWGVVVPWTHKFINGECAHERHVHGGLMWSIWMRQENSVSFYATTHAQIHVYMGVCVCVCVSLSWYCMCVTSLTSAKTWTDRVAVCCLPLPPASN